MGKTKQRRGCSKFSVQSNFFNSNDKSDEELVNTSTYPFNLDINTLTKNSPKTRRAKKIKATGTGNPPRPQNAFFLYRRDKMASPEFQNRLAEDKRAKNVSKEIAKLWDEEPMDTKEVFYALARMAERKHSETYVDYKYLKKNQQRQNDNETETSHDSSPESSSPESTPMTPPPISPMTPPPPISPMTSPPPISPMTSPSPISPMTPPPPISQIPVHVPSIPITAQNTVIDHQFFLVGCNSGQTYFLDVNADWLAPVSLTYGHTDYQQSP